jgi:hypothetical protein
LTYKQKSEKDRVKDESWSGIKLAAKPKTEKTRVEAERPSVVNKLTVEQKSETARV